MLKFLGRVFGSPKQITDIVSSASSAIDSLVYTDEERAGDASKERARARSEVVEWLKATQGQNLARRVLAFLVMGVWAGSYVVSTALVTTSVLVDSETSLRLQEASQIIDDNLDNIEAYVLSVLLFYFSANHIDSITKLLTNKRSTHA